MELRLASRIRAMRRRAAAGVVLALLVATGPAAGAQVVETSTTTVAPESTTTTTTAVEPSSTAPPATDATTLPVDPGTAPTESTTTTVPPEAEAGDDASAEDVPPDAPPDPAVTVPPRTEPPPPPTPEQLEVARLLGARVQQAALNAQVAGGLEAQADAALASAGDATAAAGAVLSVLGDLRQDAEVALDRERGLVRRWAVVAYTGGSLRRVSYVLSVGDLTELPRRLGLASGAFGGINEDLHRQRDAVFGLGQRVQAATAALDAARAGQAAAQRALDDARAQVAQRNAERAAVMAGEAVSLGGVAFPVAGPTRFGDTFGAPRMTGTPFAHTHEGTDVFAPAGTPVLAFERGVVTRLGTDVLGGTKAWLVGQSGVRYYYAHLLSYAPGLADGQVVEAGQPIGTVGNTGNAATTPSHLHFEMHPGGGPAVDPYPTLLQIAQAARTVAAAPAPPR